MTRVRGVLAGAGMICCMLWMLAVLSHEASFGGYSCGSAIQPRPVPNAVVSVTQDGPDPVFFAGAVTIKDSPAHHCSEGRRTQWEAAGLGLVGLVLIPIMTGRTARRSHGRP